LLHGPALTATEGGKERPLSEVFNDNSTSKESVTACNGNAQSVVTVVASFFCPMIVTLFFFTLYHTPFFLPYPYISCVQVSKEKKHGSSPADLGVNVLRKVLMRYFAFSMSSSLALG
jgi:hypothetical protein